MLLACRSHVPHESLKSCSRVTHVELTSTCYLVAELYCTCSVEAVDLQSKKKKKKKKKKKE